MAGLFLLTPSTPARGGQFLFFCLLAWVSGKRIRPLVTVLVMLGVICFNLLLPYGLVLVEWGPLRITSGSLEAGIRKALTLEGLIMLSAAAVRGKLPLPGLLGSLLGESFRLLDRLREQKRPARRRDLFRWLDGVLLELGAEEPVRPNPAAPAQPGKRWPGRCCLFLAVLLTAALGSAA
jgi:heptaprenyl diphosphate synthase